MKQKAVANNNYKRILLFLGMIVYKLATEWGYYFILSADEVTYPVNFNLWKYMNGWMWCLILFFGIRHRKKEASVFMLYLLFVSQVIPITSVYAIGNYSVIYYNLTCFAVLNAELMLGWVENLNFRWKNNYSKCMIWIFIAALVFLLIKIFRGNGFPTLIALNIYKVYELRGSGSFQLGKYGSYLLNWMIGAIIPFLIARCINEKKYIKATLFCGIVFTLYLYTGHKSYLFSIPLVIGCALWMRRRLPYEEIYMYFMFGFALLVFLACFSPILKELFYKIYHLIGRRVLLFSAVNKFKYYEFFSLNKKLGLYGIFPRWIVPVTDPYSGQVVEKMIAAMYYDKPDMYCNTGFLAEGYARFGYIGIFVGMYFYILVVKIMNRMQKYAGYEVTVSAFVYPMLMLTDSFLMDSLVLGKYCVMVIIMLIYQKTVKHTEEKAI